MSELTVNQLIKIVIGLLVVVAVIAGAYFIFKNKIIGFFEGMPTGEIQNLFLALIK